MANKKDKKSKLSIEQQRKLYVQEKRHLLELQNVTKIYTTKAGDTAALNGVSLTFPESGMVFITGKSGSGKTTMLNVIGGLDGIDGGEVFVGGKRFSEFSEKEYDSYRNTMIGFIFQEYNLLPDYTIEKNIGMANELQGKTVNRQLLKSLLESVDVDPKYAGRNPSQLSGGQKQRIAIVRALIKDPQIIMADEPTGALDSLTGIQVMEELKRLSKEKLVIIVSHDLELAKTYADRIIRLVDGKVAEDVLINEVPIKGNVYLDSGVLNVKAGADLNAGEALEIVKAVKTKTKISLTDKMSFKRKTQVNEKEIPEYKQDVKLISSKMKYKSAAYLGVKSLGVKPIRLIFTILLSAVAFAVFGLSDTIASYGRSKVIANLLNDGEYVSIAAGANYTSSKGAESYKINVSEETIEQINTETGYNFKGVYHITNYLKTGNQNPENISTYNLDILSPSGQRFINVPTGGAYFKPIVNGMIEFAPDEIDEFKVIKDYGYRIIAGSYPTLQRTENLETGKMEVVESSLNNVAISKYMADSILHAVNGLEQNKNFFGVSVSDYNQLIDKQIKFSTGQTVFTIVGIIDCGKIPEKYEKLKYNNETQFAKTFVQEYISYLNSTANKLLFVADGFVEESRKMQKKPFSYYSDDVKYSLDYDGDKNQGYQKPATTYSEFFNSAQFDRDNVILFSDGAYVEGQAYEKKFTLNDNEVIIDVADLSRILTVYYRNAIELNYNYYDTILNYVRVASNDRSTYAQRRDAINKLFGTTVGIPGTDDAGKGLIPQFRDDFPALNLPEEPWLYLEKVNEVTGKRENFEYKVVGVYFDINYTSSTQTGTFSPLMFNANELTEIGAFGGQGEYSRVFGLVPSVKASNNKLAKYMTSQNGLGLHWFDNSIMQAIEDNEELIDQFAQLFLYASLVLALFSVFMLYNYISTSIVSKRQSIGILRALGSGGADVFKMFLTESLVISFINGLLANIFTYIACIAVNYYLTEYMNLVVDFAIFGFRQVIVIFAISIVTAIISSIMPIIKIAKEKPVDLIRRP